MVDEVKKIEPLWPLFDPVPKSLARLEAGGQKPLQPRKRASYGEPLVVYGPDGRLVDDPTVNPTCEAFR
jgi:hypothetical protein